MIRCFQDEGSVFGLNALISLSNNESEILTIEFPSHTETWTKKSLTYTSPPNTFIVDILLMLVCSKYEGQVSFADLYLVPKYFSHEIQRKDIVADCASESYMPLFSKDSEYTSVPAQFTPFSSQSQQANITLVTHVSLDRLSVLEKTLKNWSGPVSLSIFISEYDENMNPKAWQRQVSK